MGKLYGELIMRIIRVNKSIICFMLMKYDSVFNSIRLNCP